MVSPMNGRGARTSSQKSMVRHALEDSGGFVTAQQLHRRLDDVGTPVGLATVYRHLSALADAGQVDTILTDGSRFYRACERGVHHHHLVCEGCGKAVEIDPPDETWLRNAAHQNGFTVVRHVLEVFGRCADCPDVQEDRTRPLAGQGRSADAPSER